MKFRMFVTPMLLATIVAMMMLCQAQVTLASDLSTEKKAMPTLMKMYEKNIALLQRGSVDGKTSPPMTKQQLSDTVKWLKGLKFSQFQSPIKQDFEAYRQQLLTTCAKPPASGDGYAHGSAWGNLGRKFLALMVDFDLDETKAKRYGYTKLAPFVDQDSIIIGHVMLTVQAKLDMDQFKKTKPATQVFIDLFVMCNFLSGSESRNIMLQGSVYCVHPEKVKDATQRKTLADAKAKVLGLSHHISDKEDMKLMYIALAISSLCDAHKACHITDSDLKKVGGTALVKQVHGMINLGNGKSG